MLFRSGGRVIVIASGKRLVRDLSHFNRRPRILHQCCVHSLHQLQFCCRCCQPSRLPHQQTSGITIGVATDSSLAIISRLTTTCQFMAPKEQSAELQTMFRATGTVAGITTSAIPGFSAAVITAAVLARAGLGRPSGRCGIAGNSGRLWVISSIAARICDVCFTLPPKSRHQAFMSTRPNFFGRVQEDPPRLRPVRS
jgi:hypothetical protein